MLKSDSILSFVRNLPCRFFDITPLGQILNRFSADTNIIDQVRKRPRRMCFIILELMAWKIIFGCAHQETTFESAGVCGPGARFSKTTVKFVISLTLICVCMLRWITIDNPSSRNINKWSLGLEKKKMINIFLCIYNIFCVVVLCCAVLWKMCRVSVTGNHRDNFVRLVCPIVCSVLPRCAHFRFHTEVPQQYSCSRHYCINEIINVAHVC